MNYAPVLIPTLCRYEHFRQCIESLSKCTWADKTEVYVGLDYPGKESHKSGYEQIKAYLAKQDNMGFKMLHVLIRPYNYGIKACQNHPTNVGDLVARARKEYDSYIITEDDNIFSPNFLVYMNRCLTKYKNNPDIFMICGYSYPISWDVSGKSTVLRQQFNASMWGTGLWTKKEIVFEQEGLRGKMLKLLPAVLHKRYYLKMIEVSLGEYIVASCRQWFFKDKMFSDATDISRRAWLAVANQYAITPVISKTRNLGFDGSGAYCQSIKAEANDENARSYNYSEQPIDINSDFSIVESSKKSSDENRNRLNSFDSRTPQEMKRAKQLLWICNHIGILPAKLYGLFTFPIDKAPSIFDKFLRMLSR